MKPVRLGVELLKIAAFLYVARYVTAALFMGPGLKSWSAHLFKTAYGYVGGGLTGWAIFSAGVGVVLILAGAVSRRGARQKDET